MTGSNRGSFSFLTMVRREKSVIGLMEPTGRISAQEAQILGHI
jgi:hypothetical protein